MLGKRLLQGLSRQLTRIKESPGRTARGCALGIIVNFFPTFGVGFLAAFLLASLFKASRLAAVTTSIALGGPLIPWYYALNLLVGSIVAERLGLELEEISLEFIEEYSLAQFLREPTLVLEFLEALGLAFLTGFILNSIIFGVLSYLLINHLLKKSLISGPT